MCRSISLSFIRGCARFDSVTLAHDLEDVTLLSARAVAHANANATAYAWPRNSLLAMLWVVRWRLSAVMFGIGCSVGGVGGDNCPPAVVLFARGNCVQGMSSHCSTTNVEVRDQECGKPFTSYDDVPDAAATIRSIDSTTCTFTLTCADGGIDEATVSWSEPGTGGCPTNIQKVFVCQ